MFYTESYKWSDKNDGIIKICFVFNSPKDKDQEKKEIIQQKAGVSDDAFQNNIKINRKYLIFAAAHYEEINERMMSKHNGNQ
ncbi:hypothetical protein [uncultured Chryseobacterium sp.]|uniref:hypothetical protein n=1 Tax=uncultured Chryseobacterium sp. TaxID=259322 RepID=UPI0025D48314|nr:hypothetical protein [uncultured Chryseobacterium sp.]